MATDLEHTVNYTSVRRALRGTIIAGIGILAAAAAGYMAAAQPEPSAFSWESGSAEVRKSGGQSRGYGGNVEAVEIGMDAFPWGYSPSLIEVRQGDTVRLYIHLEEDEEGNHDGEALPGHSFSILSENRQYFAFGVNETLHQGETTVIEFTADRAGEFPFMCLPYHGISGDDPDQEGHRMMDGLLRVLPGE